MSVEISYRKQVVFTILFLCLILFSLDLITRTTMPILANNSCADEMIRSQVYEDLSREKLMDMCNDYQLLQTLNTTDGLHALILPNQKSEHVNINSFGLRGDEISQKEDLHRIMVVGGSTVFGSRATSDITTIPNQLELLLKNDFGDQVEVINSGIGGADSYHEIKLIEEKLLNLNPDMIIVYDGWNDLGNTLKNTHNETYDLNTQIFLKKIESYIYLPRAIEQINHKIYSAIYLQTHGVSYTTYSEDDEEDFINKAEIWSDRWNNECKKLSNQNIDVYIFLQPMLGTSNKIHSTYENELLKNDLIPKLYQYYPHMRQALYNMSDNCNVEDFSYAFNDVDAPIYFDIGHTSDLGNKIIAKKMYDEVLPDILQTIQKID